jgi:hypothetical protein
VFCLVVVSIFFRPTTTVLVAGLLALTAWRVVFVRDRRFIALALSVAVSIWMLEFFGGKILRAHLGRTFNQGLDHRLKPNPAEGRNTDGIRCAAEAGDFQSDKRNIIFLGDSYTFGLMLDDPADPFPAQLEALCRQKYPDSPIRSVNFGWPSSSPAASHRLLVDIGARYKPSAVVLALDMTDFSDDLRLLERRGLWDVSAIAYLAEQGGLGGPFTELYRNWRVPGAGTFTGLDRPAPTEWMFVTAQPLSMSAPDMLVTERHIKQIADHCKNELKVPFILTMYPRAYQYSDREAPRSYERHRAEVLGPYVKEPFRWLDGLRARVDYPVYSVYDDFRESTRFPMHLEDDPHWNRAGHAQMAEAVLRILEKEKLVP